MDAGVELDHAEQAAAHFEESIPWLSGETPARTFNRVLFPGAVGADDAEDLAPPDLETDVAQGPRPVAFARWRLPPPGRRLRSSSRPSEVP